MSFRSKFISAIILTVFFSTIPLSLYLIIDGRKNLLENSINDGKLYSQIMARETLNTLLMNGGDIRTSQVDAREMLKTFYPLVKKGLFYTELILLSTKADRNGIILGQFPENFQTQFPVKEKLSDAELTRLSRISNYHVTPCPGLEKDSRKNICYEFVHYIGLPGKNPVAFSHLYISESEILKPLDRIETLILIGAAVVILIMSIVGLLMGNRFVRPIHLLIRGVKKIDSGNLNAPVQVISRDELGNLAESFNRMAFNLQTKITELNKEISIRKKTQEDLQDYRDNLEEIVKNRTAELIREVSAHKETAKQLVKAKEIAELANKAKSDFISNMSHEIRTPMNAILGFTEILEGIITDEIQREYLKSIGSSGKILLNLINDVLDLAKVESGKLDLEFTEVDLRHTIREVLDIFRKRVFDKGLEFKENIDPDLPAEIRIDDVRMRQILLNLVSNAIKFTNQGFIHILVQLKEKPRPDSRKVHVVISVEDSGIGVPEDQQKIIFESFVQARGQDPNQYGGTGLGLSITRNLVQLMGGSIHLESIPGKGSKFIVDLPNIEIPLEIKPHIESTEADTEHIQFEKRTVLVADDIGANRDLIQAYLKNTDLELVFARNGKEALDVIEEKIPDLVLIDEKMPVMNGMEAVQKIKAHTREELRKIPVVMVTASVWNESLSQIIKITEGYLIKPFNREALFGILARFLPHKILLHNGTEKKQTGIRENGKPVKVTGKDRKKWNLLLTTLEEYAEHRWKQLRDFHVMHEIELFVTDLNQLGKDHNYPELIYWAEDLNKYVKLYDSDAITQMIRKFPEIISKLKGDLLENH